MPGPWLEHLDAHLAVARAGEDPEGVHQVRVASGRLACFLHLSGMRVLRDDLRWLRSRASAVRDLDVLLAKHPPQPFSDWLSAERLVARAALIEALDSSRRVALTRAIGRLEALDRARAKAEIARERTRVARRTRAALRPRAALEEFHGLRRAVRRLRYDQEWMSTKSEALKRLQEVLGELNDAAVAQRLFNEWPRRDELPALGVSLDRSVEARRDRAVRELALFARKRSIA